MRESGGAHARSCSMLPAPSGARQADGAARAPSRLLFFRDLAKFFPTHHTILRRHGLPARHRLNLVSKSELGERRGARRTRRARRAVVGPARGDVPDEGPRRGRRRGRHARRRRAQVRGPHLHARHVPRFFRGCVRSRAAPRAFGARAGELRGATPHRSPSPPGVAPPPRRCGPPAAPPPLRSHPGRRQRVDVVVGRAGRPRQPLVRAQPGPLPHGGRRRRRRRPLPRRAPRHCRRRGALL